MLLDLHFARKKSPEKDTTPKEAFSNKELLKYAKDYYRKKGTGRPSKKDRRDLEDFTESVSDD